MEFKELVQKRRSMRKFEAGKKIDKKTIYKILEFAAESPSWKNSRTARYHIILDERMREKLKKECLPSFNQSNSEGASAYVVATFVKDRSGFDRDAKPMNELGNSWGIYDLGLNNMNFILAAKDENIDSLIMGLRDIEKIRGMLSIPEDEIIVSVIALGYSEFEPPKPKQKKPEEISTIY